jgi:hypothetical protein
VVDVAVLDVASLFVLEVVAVVVNEYVVVDGAPVVVSVAELVVVVGKLYPSVVDVLTVSVIVAFVLVVE